jgi:hypothetical protein
VQYLEGIGDLTYAFFSIRMLGVPRYAAPHMGDRRARTTRSYGENELVELTKKSIVGGSEAIDEAGESDDPFAEWNEDGAAVATGSQPAALPTTSRTATLADPLTTGLLAEVARRTSTVELDPSAVAPFRERVAESRRSTKPIDPEEQRQALARASRNTPTVPPKTQTTSPKTTKRPR